MSTILLHLDVALSDYSLGDEIKRMNCVTGLRISILFSYCFIISYSLKCKFPEFLQSYTKDGWLSVTHRYWKSHITEKKSANYTTDYMVKGSVIKVFKRNDEKKIYEFLYILECLEEVYEGMFLTWYNSRFEYSSNYQCVHFIRRSMNVVQVKNSIGVNSKNLARKLCSSEHLILDPWIWITSSPKFDYRKCPFQGIYRFFFGKTSTGNLCERLHLQRIESECESGEGLIFQ